MIGTRYHDSRRTLCVTRQIGHVHPATRAGDIFAFLTFYREMKSRDFLLYKNALRKSNEWIARRYSRKVTVEFLSQYYIPVTNARARLYVISSVSFWTSSLLQAGDNYNRCKFSSINVDAKFHRYKNVHIIILNVLGWIQTHRHVKVLYLFLLGLIYLIFKII